MSYRLNISIGLLLYEGFLMSRFNLSTHIFHVRNLSRTNSKNPKQKISKIVVSVYAKGLSTNNFCYA